MNRLLHAYELGMISDEEKDRFEAHLLQCDPCFKHVKEFMPRGAMLAASPEIKDLLEADSAQPERATSFGESLKTLFWPNGTPLALKPAILAAVLILLLYPAYLGLFDRGQQDIAAVQEIGLVQTRSEQAFGIKTDRSILLSFVCPESEPGQTYSITLQGPSGDVIHEQEDFSDVDNFRVGRLLLAPRLMPAGNYRLSVRANTAAPTAPPQIEYLFKVSHTAGQ